MCIEVVNLKPGTAMLIEAQVTARAESVGVELGGSDCAPNVIVIATSDGRSTATQLVDGNPDAFRLPGWEPQWDRSALREFVESEAPVRWWSISADFDTRARTFIASTGVNAAAGEGVAGANGGGGGTPPPRRDSTGSVFFNQDLVRAVISMVVVVDATKTANVSAAVLGDYIAMVTLAEIDPRADLREFPTVLNLWNDAAVPTGMTAWDVAYLDALYAAPVRLIGQGLPLRSRFQLNEIARRMAGKEEGGSR